MPTEREWRHIDAATADRNIIDRAATWLRDPKRREVAGLERDDVGRALADLLDVLGVGVRELDAGVRWQTIQSCRVVLGESMEAPGIRRTRRR